MRCCRQTEVGELLWGLVWEIENWGGCMTSLLYLFTACMGTNFSEEQPCIYKISPHCQASNPWTTNISTENIFVSPHTLKKLLCKCAHLLNVYLLNFTLVNLLCYKFLNTTGVIPSKKKPLIFATKCHVYIFTEYPTGRNPLLNSHSI